MVELKSRKRKVDINKLSDEQVDRVIEKINKKLIDICEKAAKEANEILNIYGLETKLQFESPTPIKKEES